MVQNLGICTTLLEIFDEGAYEAVNCKDKDAIDVGAFVGDSAIYFILRGARRVIAVEPHPKTYKELYGLTDLKKE